MFEPDAAVRSHFSDRLLDVGAVEDSVGRNHYTGPVLPRAAVDEYRLGLGPGNSDEVYDVIVQYAWCYYYQGFPIGNAEILYIVDFVGGDTGCLK